MAIYKNLNQTGTPQESLEEVEDFGEIDSPNESTDSQFYDEEDLVKPPTKPTYH